MKAYWARLVAANKSLSNEDTKMTISVAAFKKQIEKAYNAGAADKAEVAKKLKGIESNKPKSPLDDFMKFF